MSSSLSDVLERRGTPAVSLVTDSFVPLAKTLASEGGTPALRLAAVAPPIGGRAAAGVTAVADGVVQSVLSQLEEEI